MLDLNRVKHFLVVAEELSFSAAARRLYLDQANLSRSVRALERELGVDLFGRTSRKVWLTAAGHELVGDARRLVTLADAFTRRAASLAGEQEPEPAGDRPQRCDIRIEAGAAEPPGTGCG